MWGSSGGSKDLEARCGVVQEVVTMKRPDVG